MYNFQILKLLYQKSNVGQKIQKLSTISSKNEVKIDKILIANRGEIACRVVRTAKKLGIKTVSVYSDVDKNSLHTEVADEAYCVGSAPSSQSYLRQEKILSIAKTSKCQAIHPGYGFLSENAEFAELCQKRNIVFIGPPALAIRNMGIKSTSKIIMEAAGVPVIKGYHGDDQTNETLSNEAKKIGFPLMIKAVRGGGGKGMRIAHQESEFLEALDSARSESQKSFGDSAVLLEQYVTEPRHVEVQIFGDKYGNVVYLFERDCSVQRRHQKVIEEAPAPGISPQLRSELGEAAVRAAKAVGYTGAGTVEFILDRHSHKFYFMEMNTRLQVEHPVTEAITGLDLVEWQLRVASGEELPLKQEEIKLSGHAFEARIYAENPEKGFLPGAGKLVYLKSPETGKNVRVETGVRQSDEVSVHYDPMIAKLVVWGNNRHEALNLMQANLSRYHIAGLETNIQFIKDICCHSKFQSGHVHTGFIQENYDQLFPKIQIPHETIAEGALALILYDEYESLEKAVALNNPFNPFAVESGFRINHKLKRRYEFKVSEENCTVDVQFEEPENYLMRVNEIGPWRKVSGTLKKSGDKLELTSEIDESLQKSVFVRIDDDLILFTNERKWTLTIPKPKYVEELLKNDISSSNKPISPMPGLVDKILVKKGDKVKVGDSLLVIVAMKMEYLIKAQIGGEVEDVLCNVGDNVAKGTLLVNLKED